MHVARPILPPLEVYTVFLRGIWETRRITNKGVLHDALETALRNRLNARHLSLVCNGTMALLLASRALEFSGEVITTPFTFAATANALTWCGVTPVFADIDPLTMTLDPESVKRALTSKTTGVLPVHVFGIPCDVHALQAIAKQHGGFACLRRRAYVRHGN